MTFAVLVLCFSKLNLTLVALHSLVAREGTGMSFARPVLCFSKLNLTLVDLRSLAERGRDGKGVGGI